VKYTPRELKGNVNVSPVHPLREFFVLLSGLLGLILAVYVVLGLAVDYAVPRLPADAEQALGKLYSGRFDKARDDEQSKRLQVLLDDLAGRVPGDKRSYTVSVVPSGVSNAMALPGGNIVVFSGILDEAESENELAFVLGHELGHYADRDHLKGLGRGLVLFTISAVVLGRDSSVTEFFMNSLTGVEMKFSRDQETKADLFAVDLLNEKYGHVGGAEDFLVRAAQTDRTGRLRYYFASHPYPKDRIKAVEDYIVEKGYRSGEKTPLPETDKEE